MIQILMSTYNGEKYLEEQINSILNQTYSQLKILIRDDGSTDKTKEILKRYKKIYKNKIEIIEGENKGVIDSFFYLLNNADKRCRYFAFADQDDVWLENKIEFAIKKMNNKNGPFLYCGNIDLVDEKLVFLKKGSNKELNSSFSNALIQSIAQGCTMVFNQELLKLLINKKINYKNIVMHDSWIYLVAASFGEVFYDKDSYILYRQHSNNTIGAKTSNFSIWKRRFKNFFKKKLKFKDQIQEFKKNYFNLLENSQKEEIKSLCEKNFLTRLKNFTNLTIKRHNKIETYIFKILYLLNKY